LDKGDITTLALQTSGGPCQHPAIPAPSAFRFKAPPRLNDSSLELQVGILVACLLMSAFFSGSETGLMSLNRYRLKHLRKRNRGAKLALKLLNRPDRLLGLILIGNNAVNILASALGTVIAIRLFGDAGIAIATAVLTVVILVFSEVTPKTLAALHPERIAFPAAYVLNGLMRVLGPAVWLMSSISNGLLRVMGIDTERRPEDALSSEELRTIVNESGPMIPPRHKRMLLNILDLEQVTVDDIMVPRQELYGIDLDDDDPTLLARLQRSPYSRVAVYREDISNISGVLHLRTLGQFLQADGTVDRDAIQRAADEPYYVPEGTALNLQLLNFQKLRRRFGIVVDEYGSVLGLVTLEDILEEIVGEFTSGLENESSEISREADGSFLIDAGASIRDINRVLQWELPSEGPRTLNGLILEHLQVIPEANLGLRIGDYDLEITQLRGRMISRVRARLHTSPG
jgi:Mg2+/Co2+ transporter CorB